MNTKRYPSRFKRLAILAFTFIALPACQTVDDRISANQALFDGFSKEAQQDIRNGQIKPGYTKDMVRIAYGQPSRINTRLSADSATETWIYIGTYYTTNRYHDPFPGDRSRRNRTVFNQEYVDVENEYIRIQIEFDGDKVKSIERTKR